jgi:hypothetical protein
MVTQGTGKASTFRPGGGVLWLVVLTGALVFGYFRMMDQRQQVIDRDYYRVMFEAANSFATKLEQLNRLYQSSAPESRFKALFPGYKPEINNNKICLNKTLHFELSTDLLLIYCGADAAVTLKHKFATVSLTDVLPQPTADFSQFLFVDLEGQLLAQTGAERTVSFADMKAVMHELKQQKKTSLRSFFSSPEQTDDNDPALKMPSYSRHIEMPLSYGNYRIYMYPINLPPQRFKTTAQISHRLFLVGVMPAKPISARQENIWNSQLLLVSLFSLVFIWSFLKLYFLPRNQAVLRWVSSISYLACFSFFSLVLALVLSSLIGEAAALSKVQAAKQYSHQLQEELKRDLAEVFTELQKYQSFFQQYYLDLHTEYHDSTRALWYPRVLDFSPALLFNAAEILPNFQTDSMSVAGPCESKNGAKVALFHQRLNVTLSDDKCESATFVSDNNSETARLLLTVTAVTGEAKSSLPSFYLREQNTKISAYDLSHRAYYQRVRKGTGWTLNLQQLPAEPDAIAKNSNPLASLFHNVYVQRLLNINDGTRGTTISMPLFASAQPGRVDYGVVLLADVLLPSMNYLPPQQDFSFMVVERSSGNMLYHSDNSRTFVENLFYSGPDVSALKAAIQFDQNTDYIAGDYHGEQGHFIVTDLPAPDWALVVFYPDSSIRIYSFVWFAIFVLTIGLSLLFTLLLLYLLQIKLDTGVLKKLLGLPVQLRRRWVFSALWLMLALISALVTVLVALRHLQPTLQPAVVMLGLTIGFIVLLFIAWWLVKKWFNTILPLSGADAELNSANAAVRTLLLAALLSLPAAGYLLAVQQVPYQALQSYYQQYKQLALERERLEQHELASQLYPNSIAQRRLTVDQVLPQYSRYNVNACLQADHAAARAVVSLPVLGSLPGHQYFWQTMLSYINPATGRALAGQSYAGCATANAVAATELFLVVALVIISMLMLIFAQYIERILGGRLALGYAQLKHLAAVAEMHAMLKVDDISDRLFIRVNSVNLNGCNLASLLQQQQPGATEYLSDAFNALYKKSPFLQQATEVAVCFPNVKLAVKFCHNSAELRVVLSDIEVSLEQAKCRQQLLLLIQDIKALALAGKVAEFSIASGFHSLQRLTVKDSLDDNTEQCNLAHAEYLAWSECLMDFRIIQPAHITLGHDVDQLDTETRFCPHLRQLVRLDGYELPDVVPEPSDKSGFSWRDVWSREPDPASALATQTYLLNHADALYRFKWENCTHDEQLALYHLALGNQLNPLNQQMIKNLALNGLIRVANGKLLLMNDSFRQFVLNAEPQEQLKLLVKQGGAGFWQRHRGTIAVVILLLIAGIALTSGQSIHIIAASIAGVLSTIVSVFSNANLLKGHFRS